MMTRKKVGSNRDEFHECVKYIEEYLGQPTGSEKQYIKKIFDSVPRSKNIHIPYAAITRAVFSVEIKIDDVKESASFENRPQMLYSNMNEYFQQEVNGNEDAKYIRENIQKIVEHINLASTQRSLLYADHEQKIIEISSKLDDMERLTKTLQKTQDELDEIRKEYKSMTRDFVGIMGISSAIVFAVFGGLQQVGSIGQSLDVTPLHKVLIFSGISSLMLTYIVFMAFNAIARMTGLNLSSCKCEKNECTNHSPIHKHPTLFFMTWLFSSMVGIGFLVLLFKKYLDVPQWVVWATVFVILAFIIGSAYKIVEPYKAFFLIPKNKIKD